MSVATIITLIIALVLLVGGLVYLIKEAISFVRNPIINKFEKKDFIKSGILVGAIAVGFMLLILSAFIGHPEWKEITTHSSGVYKGNPIYYGGNLALGIIGGFLFGLGLAVFAGSLIIHLFKPKMNTKQKKWFDWALLISIGVQFASFWMWTEGFASYMSYPLVSGFSITENGFEATTSRSSRSGFHVAFYGLLILSGALLAYAVSSWYGYKIYGKRGIFDLIFIVAFPSGILGARIWYVVGNWNREFANRDFYHVFEIWNGGLTILGGAFLGIVVGALMAKFVRKDVDWRVLVDIAVPTVLFAQAIGRWGNFFNNEVYGMEVDVKYWSWLPTWLVEQMHIGTAGSSALDVGKIYVPLFLIEGTLSMIGYIFIRFIASKKPFNRFFVTGDKMGLYFLWYGIVRVIMEPFRDANFNMGTDNAWSICNSLIYIIVGITVIAGLHLSDYYKKSKNPNAFPLISACITIPVLLFPLLPSLTTSTSRDGTGTIVSYSGFELLFGGKTPLLTAAWVISILALAGFILSYVFIKKNSQYAKYVLTGSTAISLIGSLLYLTGKNLNSFGSELYVNLSYGFVLAATFSIAASVISLILLVDSKPFSKKEEAITNAE